MNKSRFNPLSIKILYFLLIIFGLCIILQFTTKVNNSSNNFPVQIKTKILSSGDKKLNFFNKNLTLVNKQKFSYPTSINELNHSYMIQLSNSFQTQLESSLKNASEKKNILIYKLPFKDPYMISPDRKRCGNCDLLWDRNLISDPKTKAVLFYFDRLDDIPKTRDLDQYWGFWTREAPPASRYLRGLQFKEFDNFFNFTMSFRRYSDIWDPYETASTILDEIIRLSNGKDRRSHIDEIVAEKTEFASWVVSNCGATPGAKSRMKIVDELIGAGLKLDRRGHCFQKSFTGGLKQFISKYKFYLAFENSLHCRDYITEKLTQNSLMSGTVPVVYGANREDLKASVPPNSYIFVEDFKNPQELVNYLNYLDKNETAYKSYFMWRTLDHKDMPNYKREANFCQLCRLLHGINVDDIYNTNYLKDYKDKPLFGYYPKPRVVPSVRNWYYGTENKECLPEY